MLLAHVAWAAHGTVLRTSTGRRLPCPVVIRAVLFDFGGVILSSPFEAFAAYERRLSLLTAAGVDLGTADFSAEFGRNLEYYTGFTFQIEADTPHGPVSVAGGGRYDNLIANFGQAEPAVGFSFALDGLVSAIGKRQSAQAPQTAESAQAISVKIGLRCAIASWSSEPRIGVSTDEIVTQPP